MRIDRIVVDNFGDQRDLVVDLSLGSFYLIYGANEAGKSSLLECVRSTLFGATKDGAELHARYSTGRIGATVETTLADGARCVVSRGWDARTLKESFFDATFDGNRVDAERLGAAFQCPSREFYANNFGISYDEVVHGSALLGRENLARLLFGLTLGDYERIARARNFFDDCVKARVGGKAATKPTLNAALIEVRAARGELAAEETDRTSNYRRQKETLEECKRALSELEEKLALASDERARRQRLLDARQDFETLQDICDGLDDLTRRARPEYAAAFDAFAHDDVVAAKKACENVATTRDALDELAADVDDALRELLELETRRGRAFIERRNRIDAAVKESAVLQELSVDFPERRRRLREAFDALASELVQLGLVARDASRDELDAATRRLERLPLDATAKFVESKSREEFELVEKTTKYETELNAARANLAAAQRKSEELREELTRRFGDCERSLKSQQTAAALQIFSDKWSSNAVGLDERTRDLATRRLDERDAARKLVRQTQDEARELDDEARERMLDALVEPIEFDSLRDRLRDAREKLKSVERDVAERRAKEDALRAEIDAAELAEISDDELAAARERRDRLWERVRDGVETLDVAAVRALLDECARAMRNVDRLFEARFERAEALGALNAKRESLAALERSRVDAEEQLGAARARVDAVGAERANLWRSFGFERCARWNDDECDAWLDEWRKRNELKRANDADERAIRARVDVAVAAARVAFKVASAAPSIAASRIAAFNAACEACSSAAIASSVANLLELEALVVAALKDATSDAESFERATAELATQLGIESATRENIRRSEENLAQLAAERTALQSELAERCEAQTWRFAPEYLVSWRAFGDALQSLRALQASAKTRFQELAALVDAETRASEFNAAVATLARELQCDPEASVFQTVERFRERLHDALDVEGQWESTRVRRDKLNARRLADETRLQEHQGRLAALREKARVSDDDQLLEFCSYCEERRELLRRRDACELLLEKTLKASRVSQEFRSAVEELAATDAAGLVGALSASREREKELLEAVDAAKESAHKAEYALERLEKTASGAPKLERYESAVARARALVDETAPLLIAKQTLDAAFGAFYQTEAPKILDVASEYFSRITGGRYSRVEPTDEDGVYTARDATSGSKKIEQLSDGTKDQLYIALRLALAQRYCEKSEPLPLLMDDLLVKCDEARAQRILALLNEFATDRRQVALFTCQESTRARFERLFGAERVVRLKELDL